MSLPLRDPRPAATAPAPAPRAEGARPRVALVGNPNTGKTTLFNHLCGLRAKTANFPGTTTDIRTGRARLGGTVAEVVDLPGLYRLDLDLPESRLVRDILHGSGVFRRPDAVVVVVDATNLARNLCLVGELLEFDVPVVVALNMVDLARRRGISVDPERLAAELGCPVVPLVARRGSGVDSLVTAVEAALDALPPSRESAVHRPGVSCYADLVTWAEGVAADSLGGEHAVGSAGDTVTERLDQAFTHPFLGVLVFGGIMFGLFWTIFALATAPGRAGRIDVAFHVNPDGTIAGWQDKGQLDPEEEATYPALATERRVFTAGPLTFGVVICHEGWRYPETVRWAVRRGAQVVFHPHAHVAERGSYRPVTFADPANTFHEKAMLCRAAENTCYFASVNCASEGSGTTSAVVRPDGTLQCFQPYGQEGLLVADLDLSTATGLLASRCRTSPM